MLFNGMRTAALLAFGITSVAARAMTGLASRSTTDVCGDVDDTLVVPGLFGIKTSFGRIGRLCAMSCGSNWLKLTCVITDQCFCQSQIPTMLKTDPQVLTVLALSLLHMTTLG